MKRTAKRLIAVLLCLLVLPVGSFAAWAKVSAAEPPAYMRALSRLVAATAGEDDFGRITLTLGEPEMNVDGQTKPIDEKTCAAPFIDENGEIQISAVIFSDVPDTVGAASPAELETYGYEVQTDLQRGTITVTEPYGLCRLIVKTENGRLRDSFGAAHVIRVSGSKTVLQYADKAAAKRAAELFADDQNVLFCEPDSICTVSSVTQTTECESWGVEAVGADQFTAGLPDNLPQVTVAVIDSGTDTDHPFLAGRLSGGWDFVNDDGDPDDDNGHGTHCAGIVRGATPDSVKIMPVKVLNAAGSGSTSVITEGIAYAADSGADVISLSLGGAKDGNVYSDAVQYALSKGAAVFAAAGNDGVCLDEHPLYPAACDDAITVAASTSSDTAAEYSDYGSCIDVASPGSGITSSVPGGGFETRSGTSMACPLAAACGALLKCEDPSRSAQDLCAGLLARARDAHTPGRDAYTGSGIVYLGATRPAENMYCTMSALTLEPLGDPGRNIEVVFEPAHPSDCSLTFQSSDPVVAVVSQTGRIRAVSAGTAVITVSGARNAFSAQIRVTVTGDGKLRFHQIESLDQYAMRFLQADGTAFAHGFSDSAFGYYPASGSSAPFKICGAPGEPVTGVARFLTENFFVKTDGSLWLVGILPTGERMFHAPIPVMIDAQTPMTDVCDAQENIVLRADGTLWYLPKNGEPYLVPVRTQDGDPLAGIARLGAAVQSPSNGLPALAENGLAYVLQTDARTSEVCATLIEDAYGMPYTDVRDVFLLKSGMQDQIVLHEDGTLTDRYDAVLVQDVRSVVAGCVRASSINYCCALKNDGSVWNVSQACAIKTADGSPLRDVVQLKICQPNIYTVQFFAVCSDGTVWAWGHNGVRSDHSESDNALVSGSLGLGWTSGTPLPFADDDGVSYAYMDADRPTASAFRYAAAQPVMANENTVLTNVAYMFGSGYTNFFVLSDGRVFCSGIKTYSGYSAAVLHAAVYARPFTLLGQQVYLGEPENPSPYTAQRVRQIDLSKPHMAAAVGETFSLTASVFPQDTMERNVYWKSSDPSVAAVDGAGNVTARGVGAAVIRAYSTSNDRVWGTCLLTVEEEPPAEVVVRQYPAKRNYTAADAFDPMDGLLTLRYANGQARSIRISADFCSGYDLTQTGEQTVTIRFAGRSFTYPITVTESDAPAAQDEPAAAGTNRINDSPYLLIWNRKPEKYLYSCGEELDVSGGSFYADAWDNEVSLTAEMCSGFDPMRTGEQTVTVTFACDGTPASLTFDVFVTELTLENEVLQIGIGKCTRILAVFAPVDADGREIVWTSGDERIATVDKYGRVTGVAPGTVEIAAQVKGSGAVTSCAVTVVPKGADRMPGDADCDGEVTLKDAVQITRFLAGGWDAAIDLRNADVNGDNEVNLKDVVLLRRFLAGGWDILLV